MRYGANSILAGAILASAAFASSAAGVPRDGEIIVEKMDDQAAKCGLTAGPLERALRDALVANRVRPSDLAEFKIYLNVTALPIKDGCAVHVRLQGFFMASQRASWETRPRDRVTELCDEGYLMTGEKMPERVAEVAGRQVRDCLTTIMND